MEIAILGFIILGVGGVFIAVFMLLENKKSTVKGAPKKNGQKSSGSIKADHVVEGIKKDDRDIRRKDILNFVEFDKVADDMIIQEKETKYTMILQCKGINYDLMSEVEQLSVEEGFITFLNTIKYPIQLYVQARSINLKNSLDIYKSRVSDINSKFDFANENLKQISDKIGVSNDEIDKATIERNKLLNISEYAQDITRYVEKLSLNKHMLQRKFYVVLSYYKSEVSASSNFTKEEVYDICNRELYTRSQSVASALMACSVSSKILSSNELAELLYISYNRDDEKLLDIKSALDSGFYRMYSTSEDINVKKKTLMDKQIAEVAMSKIEQAINNAISKGMLITEDDMIEEFENESDREAINIVESANIDEEDKNKIKDYIIDEHKKGVAKRTMDRDEKLRKLENIDEKNIKKDDVDNVNKIEFVNDLSIIDKNIEKIETVKEISDKNIVSEENADESIV